MNNVLFRKMTGFPLLHPSMTHSCRLSRLRETLPLKLNPQASKMSKKQMSLESFFAKGKGPSEKTEEEPTTSKKKKAAFNRQYQESYLKYGFIATGDSRAPSPLCIICGKQLSNEAMKPSKLLCHLETKHRALKDKPSEYFERKKHEQEGQKQLLRTTTWTLCDIFSLPNELNRSLQGKMTTVFKLADKVAAFKAKLDLWGQRMNRGIFDMFQTFAGILEETEPQPSFTQLVHDHLSFKRV